MDTFCWADILVKEHDRILTLQSIMWFSFSRLCHYDCSLGAIFVLFLFWVNFVGIRTIEPIFFSLRNSFVTLTTHTHQRARMLLITSYFDGSSCFITTVILFCLLTEQRKNYNNVLCNGLNLNGKPFQKLSF